MALVGTSLRGAFVEMMGLQWGALGRNDGTSVKKPY
jgi:hypothetical protein